MDAVILKSVDDHLNWNVNAYGKAWTGELEDTRFIVSGATKKALDALAAAGLRVLAVATEPTPCTICGDTEPSHVHRQGERIDDYFTVGRGESDLEAARRWQERALAADRGQHSRERGTDGS